MNYVKKICDRIIELLPGDKDIHISLHADHGGFYADGCGVFIGYDRTCEHEIWAKVTYKNKKVAVREIVETKLSEEETKELAKLGFKLLYCHAGDLLDYGTYIRKNIGPFRGKEPYYLDIISMQHKKAYIGEFER